MVSGPKAIMIINYYTNNIRNEYHIDSLDSLCFLPTNNNTGADMYGIMQAHDT